MRSVRIEERGSQKKEIYERVREMNLWERDVSFLEAHEEGTIGEEED